MSIRSWSTAPRPRSPRVRRHTASPSSARPSTTRRQRREAAPTSTALWRGFTSPATSSRRRPRRSPGRRSLSPKSAARPHLGLPASTAARPMPMPRRAATRRRSRRRRRRSASIPSITIAPPTCWPRTMPASPRASQPSAARAWRRPNAVRPRRRRRRAVWASAAARRRSRRSSSPPTSAMPIRRASPASSCSMPPTGRAAAATVPRISTGENAAPWITARWR